MSIIVETFLSTIKEQSLIQQEDSILLGLSGGPDSVCLLELLSLIQNRYNLRLGLAHINYALRADESDRDENFVRELAISYNLPVFIKHKPIIAKSNIQARARHIRFTFFKQIIDKENYNKLALAHNLDDLIENFFLRLAKGSSLKGLSSFSYSNKLKDIYIIRPLLDISKKEIIKYLDDRPYKIDSSNLEIKYKRNELRLKVLPALEKAFPQYRKTIIKTITQLKEDNNYIQKQIANTIKTLTVSRTERELKLDIIAFKTFSIDLQKRIVAKSISIMDQQALSQKTLLDLIKKIDSFSAKGSSLLFRRSNFLISLEYNYIVFTLESTFLSLSLPISLVSGKTYNISDYYNLCVKDIRLTPLRSRIFTKKIKKKNFILVNKSKLTSLSVRSLKKGDRIYFNKKIGHKKIKELLINKKLARLKRKEVLILLNLDKPIAILSPYLTRLAEAYYIDNNSISATRISIKTI